MGHVGTTNIILAAWETEPVTCGVKYVGMFTMECFFRNATCFI